ncbi:MAG: SdrD B-like domain-containing protein [Chloroflexota bacterium]
MRIRTLIAGVVGVALLIAAPALAQESLGQFCVRSFEDVNANGLFDTETERLITRGVSVELLNEQGVVVSSALLDRSPTVSNGIICFYELTPGDYSVLVSSADYLATTDRLVQQSVSATLPTIVEFGARRVGSDAVAVPLDTGTGSLLGEVTLVRVAAAAVGAAILMVVFLLTGFVIFGMRSRRATAPPAPVQFSPQSVRSMEPMEPAQNYAPPPVIQEPPVSDEDTNPNRTV